MAHMGELTPAAIRVVVRELGDGEGRGQVAAGNRILAGQLGVTVRTVQRWQKEGGEARAISRSTPGLKISVQGIATEVQRAANARLSGAGAGAGTGRGGVPGDGVKGPCRNNVVNFPSIVGVNEAQSWSGYFCTGPN